MADKPKGPAAYFPSIKEIYGKPMTHWFTILEKSKVSKHSELVNLLKAEYGHGHANAIVAYRRAARIGNDGW